MGCFGNRSGEAPPELADQQKWDYINLKDFKSKSCATFISYVWLWILVFVAIAVYAADTFTAVKLLVFDQWSSQVQPAIPFKYSKWIFAICIIFSWALLVFEWQRALRVIRRGGVAEDYMDPLAVKLQSMRWGGGWRRFLVFAELTKSKKKVTWIALFVYFQRKGAIRLLAAEGPRQFVNALTLVAVAKANLIPTQQTQGFGAIEGFFKNLGVLAGKDSTQTIILSSMAFTLTIWVVSALFILLALILYLLVLWHHIQNETLEGYCRRKVETRLEGIVKAKTEKIWAKQQKKREKEERKALEQGQAPALAAIQRQPTLPTIAGSPPDKTGEFMLHRNDSVATLPPYSSRPQTPADSTIPPLPRQPTLPNLGNQPRPGPLRRSPTAASTLSNTSYASNVPLLQDAASPGLYSPSPVDSDFRPGPLSRTMTTSSAASNRSYSAGTMQNGQQGHAWQSERGLTGGNNRSFTDRPYTPGQVTYDRTQHPHGPPLAIPPPTRTNTGFSHASQRSSPLSASTNSPLLARGRSPISPYDQRIGSAAGGSSYELSPVSADEQDYSPFPNNNWASSAGNGMDNRSRSPAALMPGQNPRRDFSAPTPGPGAAIRRGPTPFIPQRSATAPIPEDEQWRRQAGTPVNAPSMPRPGGFQRSQTSGPAPYNNGWR